MKYWSPETVEAFWERRTAAKEERNKRMAALPFAEKLVIAEKLQRDALSMEEARQHEEDKKAFGLGPTPEIAINHYETLIESEKAVV